MLRVKKTIGRNLFISRSREFPKLKRVLKALLCEITQQILIEILFMNSRYEVYKIRATFRRFLRLTFSHSEKLKIVSFFAVLTL